VKAFVGPTSSETKKRKEVERKGKETFSFLT
jgi:hypothetical protein